MGFVSDVLGFEKFNLSEVAGKIKKNPERLFLGALDPAGSKAWGKVLGKDYEPALDWYGGPTKQTYAKAREAGIDTDAGENMHKVARAVVGVVAGGYGSEKLGMLGAPTGGDSAAGGATDITGAGMSPAGGSGGTSAGAPNWKNSLNQMPNQGMQQPQQQRMPQQEPIDTTKQQAQLALMNRVTELRMRIINLRAQIAARGIR